jgi:hypothetical protein
VVPGQMREGRGEARLGRAGGRSAERDTAEGVLTGYSRDLPVLTGGQEDGVHSGTGRRQIRVASARGARVLTFVRRSRTLRSFARIVRLVLPWCHVAPSVPSLSRREHRSLTRGTLRRPCRAAPLRGRARCLTQRGRKVAAGRRRLGVRLGVRPALCLGGTGRGEPALCPRVAALAGPMPPVATRTPPHSALGVD